MTTNESSKAPSDPIAKKRTFSAEAIGRMKEKAKQRGVVRAEAIATKIRQAMTTITMEMTGCQDGYLSDGRLVTEALLYERASVHWTTLSKNPDTYGELLVEVKAWKAGLTEKKPTQENKRRTLAQRLNDAKNLYDRLLKSFQFVELELQQAEAERDKALKDLKTARSDLETAKQQNVILQERLYTFEGSKILQLRGAEKADNDRVHVGD